MVNSYASELQNVVNEPINDGNSYFISQISSHGTEKLGQHCRETLQIELLYGVPIDEILNLTEYMS